ncbi:MAG: hypothetical protein GTO14_21615 [Anaerolineales bacterium]|nr:hypothetical protein [Anaerolineales bacterium]
MHSQGAAPRRGLLLFIVQYDDGINEARAADVQIRGLRAKIAQGRSNLQCILTGRGAGYYVEG